MELSSGERVKTVEQSHNESNTQLAMPWVAGQACDGHKATKPSLATGHKQVIIRLPRSDADSQSAAHGE